MIKRNYHHFWILNRLQLMNITNHLHLNHYEFGWSELKITNITNEIWWLCCSEYWFRSFKKNLNVFKSHKSQTFHIIIYMNQREKRNLVTPVLWLPSEGSAIAGRLSGNVLFNGTLGDWIIFSRKYNWE